METPLTHGGKMFRLNFVDDTDFARLAIGILVLAKIFLRQAVNMFVGALFGDLRDPAADLQIAIGVLWVLDGHSHTRVAAKVAVFLAAARGVDANLLPIEIHPHRRNLRAPVGHQRGQVSKRGLAEEIEIFFGDALGHDVLRAEFHTVKSKLTVPRAVRVPHLSERRWRCPSCASFAGRSKASLAPHGTLVPGQGVRRLRQGRVRCTARGCRYWEDCCWGFRLWPLPTRRGHTASQSARES